MGTDFDLHDLEVVAYADRLEPGMTPTIVPPVFRFRSEPAKVVFPPFRFEGNRVINGTVGFAKELRGFEQQGEVTKLPEVLSARPGYELWVDEDMSVKYEPDSEVEKKLRGKAEDAIRQAKRAFLEGRFDAAEKFITTALSADDRLVEPFIISAAIGRIHGNLARVDLMRQAASSHCTGESFDEDVAGLVQRHQA